MQIPCHLGTLLPYIQQEICSQNPVCVYYHIFIVALSFEAAQPLAGVTGIRIAGLVSV